MKAVFCLIVAAAPLWAASLAVSNLKCEYRANPAGIDEQRPRLSWQLDATAASSRNLTQSAYRVIAASSAASALAGKGDLWDSGKVTSSQSVLVPYAGQPLISGQKVWWRVMTWDQAGAASPWSATATWSMGLLNAQDWHGRWIGKDEKEAWTDPHSPFQLLRGAEWIWTDEGEPRVKAPAATRLFRTTVTLPAARVLKTAMLIVGADNRFECTVNGQLAGKGGSVTMPMIFDAAPFLKAGENTIEVKATNTREDPAGVIAALKVDFTAGEPLIAKSGATWQTAPAAGQPWQSARAVGAYGVEPWGEVGIIEERALPARLLRKEFEARPGLKRATAYLSGLGLSELYVNGTKAGDHVLSPNLTGYDKRVFYVTHDITAQLAAGRNAVGVILGNGRHWQPRGRVPIGMRGYGAPKAIVQIELEYADGKKETVASDASWKLTADGPVRVNNEYDGEEYDARAEMPGWAKPGFDDSKWQPVEILDAPPGALVAQMAEPLKVMETLQPKSIKQIRPGVFIYDMGQNMVGWCRLRVAGPRGARIQLRFAETLRPDGNLYIDNLRSARATNTYWLKGGAAETWEPRFVYHGFRYVEVTGFPGTPTLASIEGRVVHDSLARAGDWTSSSDMLNRIHHNIFWGVRGNYRSIPTDCPQRDEKQGWLGDRSVVSRSESYLFDVAAFYTKWITDINDAQRESGSVPDVVPNYWVLYNDGIVWPSTFILAPQMVYEQYGDLRVIERNYPAMKKWIQYMRGFMKNGIMPKNTYGDWCVPPEDPKLIHSQDPKRVTSGALISTAYFHHMARLMSRYATLLGNSPDAAGFDALAAELKLAFLREYYKASEARFDNGTQTSSVLPLALGLAPDEARARIFDSLVDKIEKENSHVGVGLVGAQWLMRTLSENGRPDLAFTIATQKTYPGWGYMVEKGATTVWELWNGDTADPAMNSGNHVMQIGDLGVWMYEYLAGIRSDPARPGFAHAIVKPYPPAGLASVGASHRSPYGLITSRWRRAGASLTLDVTVPPNTTATIHVPGQSATEAGGAKPARTESGAVVFEVGSGRYQFTAR